MVDKNTVEFGTVELRKDMHKQVYEAALHGTLRVASFWMIGNHTFDPTDDTILKRGAWPRLLQHGIQEVLGRSYQKCCYCLNSCCPSPKRIGCILQSSKLLRVQYGWTGLLLRSTLDQGT
mmetsp:Transcript_33848/g.82048  ORF Transcript_33848/g.82048 Transcript_33848/m.82048 type:complete len:120 (-) Transcript_33848:349-708(-)